MPVQESEPIRFPDGLNAKTVCVNIVSTGRIDVPAFGTVFPDRTTPVPLGHNEISLSACLGGHANGHQWAAVYKTSQDGGQGTTAVTESTVGRVEKGGEGAVAFFPGGIYCSHGDLTGHLDAAKEGALHEGWAGGLGDDEVSFQAQGTATANVADNANAYKITGAMKASGSQDKNLSGILQSAAADAEAYRVTACTIKLEFVGSHDDNEGELIIHKYSPNINDPDDFENTVNQADQTSTCRVMKRASKGAFITVGRSHSTPAGGWVQFQANDAKKGRGHQQMEAIVCFFQQCKNAENTGTANATFQTAMPSTPFRYEMVQTIELLPKQDVLLTNLAVEAHPEIPLMQSAYAKLMKNLEDSGYDIVDCVDKDKVRAMSYGVASRASSSVAAATGLRVPSKSFSNVGISNPGLDIDKLEGDPYAYLGNIPLHNREWNHRQWYTLIADGALGYLLAGYGFTSPTHPFCGPFNRMDGAEVPVSDNRMNELCRLHDVWCTDIARTHDVNIYTHNTWADDKFRSLIRQENLHKHDNIAKIALWFYDAKAEHAPRVNLPIPSDPTTTEYTAAVLQSN